MRGRANVGGQGPRSWSRLGSRLLVSHSTPSPRAAKMEAPHLAQAGTQLEQGALPQQLSLHGACCPVVSAEAPPDSHPTLGM